MDQATYALRERLLKLAMERASTAAVVITIANLFEDYVLGRTVPPVEGSQAAPLTPEQEARVREIVREEANALDLARADDLSAISVAIAEHLAK